MRVVDRLSRLSPWPVLAAFGVIALALCWFVGLASNSSGWLFGDAFVHLAALGVAVGFGFKHRRWGGLALAVASPFVFIGLINAGDREPCDWWGSCPTNTTIASAYVVANVFLVIGLAFAAYRREPS